MFFIVNKFFNSVLSENNNISMIKKIQKLKFWSNFWDPKYAKKGVRKNKIIKSQSLEIHDG